MDYITFRRFRGGWRFLVRFFFWVLAVFRITITFAFLIWTLINRLLICWFYIIFRLSYGRLFCGRLLLFFQNEYFYRLLGVRAISDLSDPVAEGPKDLQHFLLHIDLLLAIVKTGFFFFGVCISQTQVHLPELISKAGNSCPPIDFWIFNDFMFFNLRGHLLLPIVHFSKYLRKVLTFKCLWYKVRIHNLKFCLYKIK